VTRFVFLRVDGSDRHEYMTAFPDFFRLDSMRRTGIDRFGASYRSLVGGFKTETVQDAVSIPPAGGTIGAGAEEGGCTP
jgi:hypothetical protein